MSIQPSGFPKRIESIRIRINSLDSLRKLVALPPAYDITARQWSALDSQLSSVKARLLSKLKSESRKYLPHIQDLREAGVFNALLGDIELEMARAFVIYDTYADVLTQRHSPELGPALAGCDALAWDAIYRNHPALSAVEPPLVYCDRGFGASTLREGVSFPDKIPNPLPLIQIPYSRLKEKHNLTSILHEAGHEAMVRLDLVRTLPRALSVALSRAGAPEEIARLYSLWTAEIGPDFWTFCLSGLAQPATVKEILALPRSHVFRISWIDPHPPPYLRVLLSVQWCRQVWGRGLWDKWEREWKDLYPLQGISSEEEKILSDAVRYIPLVGSTLLNTRFKVLEKGRISDLFDLAALAPTQLQKVIDDGPHGSLDLKGLSPCKQLAVFRLLREQNKLNEEQQDKIMAKWLWKLGEKRRYL
jgi:hypothetical protein